MKRYTSSACTSYNDPETTLYLYWGTADAICEAKGVASGEVDGLTTFTLKRIAMTVRTAFV